MWRTAFGVLLVAHGLLTIVIWSPGPSAEAPMDTSRSGGVLSLALFGLFFTGWWLLAIAISSALVVLALRELL